MVQVLSKLAPIRTSCIEFVHPWTDSCMEATAGLYIWAIFDSFRIYGTVYLITLLMKGKIPTMGDLKNTFMGICQSTAFLSATAFGYSMFLCFLRRVMGSFNILTVSAIPAFLSSVFAIIIERPARRTMLCLYVSNVATETLWNMAAARKWVRPIPHGEVAIFSLSMAVLLVLFKHGKQQINEKPDSMFGVIRFVVGRYENRPDRVHPANTGPPIQVVNNESVPQRQRAHPSSKNFIVKLIFEAFRTYKRLVYKIKCYGRHYLCSHPFSCAFYTLEGATGMFTFGLGIQVVLKLILQSRTWIRNPKAIKSVLFKKDTLSLGAFLGGFSGLFRLMSCLLRRYTGKDSPWFAFPAGLVAGIAFAKFPNSTLALYVMWKTLQLTYCLGIKHGYLPNVPGFTNFLYCFSTAVLFHAAMLEPKSLRSSYWKFLCAISGGRVACMSRAPLDVWGLETSKSLEEVLIYTKTKPLVKGF